LLEAFERGDLAETIKRVDENFSEGTYTLRRLFRDEQQKIVDLLYQSLRESVDASFRRIYESTAPILRNLAESLTPVPPALRAAAEFYLNEQIRAALVRSPPDVPAVRDRMRELERANLSVDTTSIPYDWARAAERLMDGFAMAPDGGDRLHALRDLVTLARDRSIPVDLSRVQNRYYSLLHGGEFPGPSREGAPAASNYPPEVAETFRALGEQLRVRVA
jgi:hypothetical protein